MYVLIALTLVFTQLSLLAFGGGNAILPEMQHQVVVIHQWMTAEQFSSMFAMAQAAPGPNMMIVPLVGWHVAGPMGLIVTSFAKFGPSSIITIYALKFWNNFKTLLDDTRNNAGPWQKHVQFLEGGNKKGGDPTATEQSPVISQNSFADSEDAYFITWR